MTRGARPGETGVDSPERALHKQPRMSEPTKAAWPARLRAYAGCHAAALAACLFATGWFFYLGYGATLDPSHIAWMNRGDWAAYLWGFQFFRNADWHFPLGATPELFYPFGTSVGFTDANPWLGVLFKLLSPLLPVDFQYSGLWFLLCFVLQAWFGARITSTMTSDKVRQALGGALFAFTPILPARSAHVAISAMFFVTAGVYLHLKRLGSRQEALRTAGVALLLLVWADGYLSVMLLVLVLALALRMSTTDGLFGARDGVSFALAAVGVTVATYWLFGYIGWRPLQLTEEGFGDFSGDLTALVNPQRWSRFFDGLRMRPRQWEGFLYLGTGVFGLLALGLGWLAYARPSREAWRASLRRSWALALVLALMWFYSLSCRVAYLGETVWNLESLYEPFASLTGIFRTSGRFAWPLHMALIAAGVAAACALPRALLGRLALVAALALQAVELNPERLDFSDVDVKPLRDPLWTSAGQEYQHLRLVPLQLLWVCKYDHKFVNRLSYAAYRQKLTFNSGNFMRKEPDTKRLCDRGLEPTEQVDPETVYVVERKYLRELTERGAACGRIEGLHVCVSAEKSTRLLAALRRS
jgi:hypothetical protein